MLSLFSISLASHIPIVRPTAFIWFPARTLLLAVCFLHMKVGKSQMTSLQRPDDSAWHSREHYSSSAARKITRAYADISQAGQDKASYLRAYAKIAPLLGVSLIDEQSLRVQYVVSMAYSADEDYPLASESLSKAIKLATQLVDNCALIDLLYFRGSVYRALGELGLASDDFCDALRLRHEYAAEGTPTDIGSEITLLAGAAGFNYFLGRLDFVAELLEDAKKLADQLASPSLEIASIYWVRSLLHHYNGEFDDALQCSMYAADMYTALGNFISASRIQASVAQIALDIAKKFMDQDLSGAASAYLDLASSYIKKARILAREAADPISLGLVSLAGARHDSLAGSTKDILARLRRVVQTAKQNHDTALLAQTYLSLGRVYETRLDIPTARDWYNKVIAELDEESLQIFQMIARRALLHLSEMYP